MEQKFTSKRLLSLFVVLAMLFTSFAFVLPASAETANVALGKTYEAQVYSNYTAGLTDGVMATTVATNNTWFAFYQNGSNPGNAPERVGEVIVDLDGNFAISEVKINVGIKTGWGIAAPASVYVSFSSDKEAWSTPVAVDTITANADDASFYSAEVSATARYAKFELAIADGSSFVFFNEIEIYGEETEEHTCMGVGDWQTDETNHWKLCSCGEITDEAAHDEGEWVVTKKAEAGVDGEQELRCTVCEYVLDTEAIEALPVETLTNLTQGNSYTTTVTPNSSYGDAGNAELTDGYIVTDDNVTAPYYGDSHWVGFNVSTSRNFDFEVALGTGTKVYDLYKIVINVGSDGCTSGVTEPDVVAYYTADGSNWTEFGSYTRTGEGITTTITFAKETPVKASAIKVNFSLESKPGKNLLWVGEVQGFGEELPEDEHICIGSGEWQKDETNHWKVCECGENAEVAAHDEGRWVVATPAVPGTDGLMELQCTVCGYALDSEVIVAPVYVESYDASDFGAWKHWTYDTSDDGVKLIDGSKGYNGIYAGSIGWYFNANNTTEADGGNVEIVFTLDKVYDIDTIVGYFYHYAPSSYSTVGTFTVSYSVDGAEYTTIEAEAVKEGTENFTLTIALDEAVTAKYIKVNMTSAINSLIITDEIEFYGVEYVAPPHECVAGDEIFSDENGHWNECECGEKMNEAAHDEGEWVETKPAEIGVEGEKELRCTVCEYVLDTDVIEALPEPHECVAGDEIFSDENGHWNECECGEKMNEAAHDEGEWVETKPAEIGVEGEKELRCTVCEYVLDTDVIEALPEPTPDPEPVLPPEDADKTLNLLTNGGFALSDFTIFVRLGDLTTIGEVAGALRGIEADSADADYNYYALILVDAEGNIVEVNTTLGRPAGAKNEVVIPEGGYALLMHADNADYSSFSKLTTEDTIVLTNVDLEALATATEASELTDAYVSIYFAPVPPIVEGDLVDVDNYTVSDTAVWVPDWADVTADDGVKLIDGVKGTNGLAPALDGWYFGNAYTDGGNIELVFTLAATYSVDNVVAYIYDYAPSVYATANTVKVYYSIDGEEYLEATVAVTKVVTAESAFALVAALEEAVNAKYIKVVLTAPANSLVLIDEIEIYGVEYTEPDPDPSVKADYADIDGDGYVDSADYLLLKRACYNTYELTEEQVAIADLDGDGELTSADYMLLKRIAFGTLDLTPVEPDTEA